MPEERPAPDPHDEVEAIAAAENEGMVAEKPPPDLAPQESFLEETPLPLTVENSDLAPGTLLTWGNLTFAVGEPYLAGWYRATQDSPRYGHQPDPDGATTRYGRQPGPDGATTRYGHQPGPDGATTALLNPGLDGTLLAEVGGHRLLPKLLYAGPEGVAVAAPEGEPVGRGLSLQEALEVLRPLAQFVYFLELKGLTLLDLEPRSLLRNEGGLRLVPPPRLARIGSRAEPLWREGYTPPEVLAEATLSAKAGVYLLGALLFELLSGTALPAEGPSDLLLMGISLAGVPQALNQLLAPVDERPTPQQALMLFKSLSAPPLPVLEVGAATSIGLNPDRPYNEDAFAYRLERVQAHANHTLLLRACVADGMGGMAAGERASQAAVETFVAPAPPYPLDDPQAQADWAVRLVWEANAAVLQALGGRDGGCTISAVLLVGARYALAHVGDTRAYSWSGQGLRQISRDHSLVGALLASGMITPEEAAAHPDRNKVLRSLGSLRQPQEGYVDGLPDAPTATLLPGEALLLVSDGVWGEVSDHRMAEILSHNPTPQAAAEALVAAALEAGAPDNATALIVRRVG